MNDKNTIPKLLLTVREAAAALSICERTLWAWTDAGQIKVVRIGAAVRYAVSDLLEFIAKQSSGKI